MLYVMTRSGLESLVSVSKTMGTRPARLVGLVQSAAVAQVLIAVLALTSYHVQIISRIASGYPLWYWWLAQQLSGGQTTGAGNGFVMFMVMYASIQGVLFASFLPPA